MSLVNAIKAFVDPDSVSAEDSSQDTGTDTNQTSESLPDTTNTEEAVTPNEGTEAVDSDSSDGGEDSPAVTSQSRVEGDYWPYMVQPTESANKANYEVEQHGYPITEDGVQEDDEDIYMGSWPRQMIESSGQRADPKTWLGYQDDPVKKVDSGGIPQEYLFRHSLIFGETGQGKTTLLMNMMLQWIYGGHGMCFIDPKGKDAKTLIQRIPPSRRDDVIWVEPGSKRDKMIGFNLLEIDADKEADTQEFNDEVESVVKQFTEVIKNTEESSGAVINEVTEEVTRFLVKADYDYNVLDLYAILFNEDDRKKLPEFETDQFGKLALQSVAEKEDEDLESLRRRVRPWVTDVNTREVLDVRESGINLTKAIEDGKLLIVKADNLEEQVIQMFVTALVRRIWSTIQQRTDMSEDEYDPYFLVVDEFDDVAVDRLGIGEILKKARAFDFSITLATQQPSKLDKDVQDEVITNSKNIFTYSPGSDDDARKLAKELGDIDSNSLGSLRDYQIAGTLMTDGEPHTVTMKAFPPYPPLHTPQEAEEIIEQSLDRYGKEQNATEWSEASLEDYGIVDSDVDGEGDGDALETFDVSGSVSLTKAEFLRCIFLAQVKKPTRMFNGEGGYVQKDDLVELIEERYGEVKYKAVDRIAEEEIESHLVDSVLDGEVFFKLTDSGEAEAFDQDTGEGGSAGGAKHRKVLSTSWKEFTRLGYDVVLPNQEEWEGSDPPDGLATPPIKPFQDANNKSELLELETRFESEYQAIAELFGSDDVAIEAETTTFSRPKQTIKNLKKAVERSQKCALVVSEKDYSDKNDDDDEGEFDPYENHTPEEALEANAKKVYNIFSDPPFIRDMTEDGRVFYNLGSSKALRLKGGKRTAIQKSDETKTRVKWREDGNRVILENGSNDDTISFRKASKINDEPSKNKFNYYYEKDQRNNIIIVKNSKGETLEEYDTVTQMENDGWEKITPPLIPESFFDGEEPTRDDWEIMVVPRESNPEYDSEKLYLYQPSAETKFTPIVDLSETDFESDSDEDEDGEESDTNEEDESTPDITMPSVGSGPDDPAEEDDEEKMEEVDDSDTETSTTSSDDETQTTQESTKTGDKTNDEEAVDEERGMSAEDTESGDSIRESDSEGDRDNADEVFSEYRSDENAEPVDIDAGDEAETDGEETTMAMESEAETEDEKTETEQETDGETNTSSGVPSEDETDSDEDADTGERSVETDEEDDVGSESDDEDEVEETSDETDDWSDYTSSSIDI